MRISDWSSDVCSSDLAGDDTALKAAAAQVMAGKRLQSGVVTPAEGIAKLFSRLAADMGSDRPSQIALAVARLATFLAPHDAEGWLITTDMLAADDKTEASLEALTHIAPTHPSAAHPTHLERKSVMEGKRGEYRER